MTIDRARLVELVERLIAGEYDSEAECDALLSEFEGSVPHPGASDLIFYPRNEFDHEPSAAEVVDRALSYRPIEL